MKKSQIKVGDEVQYYCFTDMIIKTGKITARDIPVKWQLSTKPGQTHLLGYEINGQITRPYEDAPGTDIY